MNPGDEQNAKQAMKPSQTAQIEMPRLGILQRLEAAPAAVNRAGGLTLKGRVAAVSGMMVEVAGLAGHAAVGDRITLATLPNLSQSSAAPPAKPIDAEIVGFRAGHARALAFGALAGIGPGCVAAAPHSGVRAAQLAVSDGWLGRIVDPNGLCPGRIRAASNGYAAPGERRAAARCNPGAPRPTHRPGSTSA